MNTQTNTAAAKNTKANCFNGNLSPNSMISDPKIIGDDEDEDELDIPLDDEIDTFGDFEDDEDEF